MVCVCMVRLNRILIFVYVSAFLIVENSILSPIPTSFQSSPTTMSLFLSLSLRPIIYTLYHVILISTCMGDLAESIRGSISTVYI